MLGKQWTFRHGFVNMKSLKRSHFYQFTKKISMGYFLLNFSLFIIFSFFFRDALQSVITALYCKIVVILGLAFPMAEVVSDNVAPGYYQLFYVYLFLMSLIFLLVIYIDLWKSKATWAISHKRRHHSNPNHEQDHTDGIFKLPRPRVHYGSFYLRLGAVCKYMINYRVVKNYQKYRIFYVYAKNYFL